MNSVVNLPGHKTRESGAYISFVPSYYEMDYDRNTVRFTEAGRRYYFAWFKRFGFTLNEEDAKSFVEGVMFINRQLGGMNRDELERKLQTDQLTDAEKSMWRKYLDSDFEGFTDELVALAVAPMTPPNNVLPMRRR